MLLLFEIGPDGVESGCKERNRQARAGDCPVLLTDHKEDGSVAKQAGREDTKCLNKTKTYYMLNTNFKVLPLAHGDRPYAPGTKRRGHFSLLYRSGSSSKEQQWVVAFPINLSRGCKRGLSRLKAGVSFLTIPRSSFIPPAFLSLLV